MAASDRRHRGAGRPFAGHAHGVTPTEAGLVITRPARRLLTELHRAEEAPDDLAGAQLAMGERESAAPPDRHLPEAKQAFAAALRERPAEIAAQGIPPIHGGHIPRRKILGTAEPAPG